LKNSAYRIAVVFPANQQEAAASRVEDSRLAGVALALGSAGAQVVSAPFHDNIASEIETRLDKVDFILVWYNPFEKGADRSGLNVMLKRLADQGVRISTHPDMIEKIGTKDVLYRTRHMPWGSDVLRYSSIETMQLGLLESLTRGPRVVKQLRGQSGDGVWQVRLSDAVSGLSLAVRHAKRGSSEQLMTFADFLALCRPYFAHSGAMIDQAYQPRLHEGMIRCYLVGNKVVGFGEQLINALYPVSALNQSLLTGSSSAAPEPGPRLYFPADRVDFQALKQSLEVSWLPQMCQILEISAEQLPVLWDADFMLGEKSSSGFDSYVLCEINVCSVYPFPPSALEPMVTEVLRRCNLR
jgi:hypothetical protein